MNKNKQLIISGLALLSLVLVTTGVSYSLLDYDESSVSSHSNLTYKYVSTDGVSTLNVSDFTPVADEVGKQLSTDGHIFEFSIDGSLRKNESIPFEVTISKMPSSTLDGKVVKVYLTEVINGIEYPVNTTISDSGTVKTYNDLSFSSVVGNLENRTVYEGTMEYGYNGRVHRDFRLRVWTSQDITTLPSYNNNSLSLKVNIIEKEK